MSASVKTLIFVGVSLVVIVVAMATYPRQETFQAPSLQGKPLFKDFSDPEIAAQLKIAEFAEDVGKLSEFEVARDKKSGLWTIPSSSNYPADAETQMRDAATALIDLRVLAVIDEGTSSHEVFGVVEPNKEKLQASQSGVGLMVNVKSAKGKDLAKLIIGKKVKDAENQRYVRVPGQNAICVVEIDPEKFPTDFEKWIERDLLKINTLDVERVSLRDYSILTSKTLTGIRLDKFEQRFEADAAWDTEKNEWQLKKLVEFPNGKPRPTALLDTEELNKENLDGLKTALGDLKIVGVRRKPKGLGADLKAGTEIMKSQESLESLVNRGFFPVQIQGQEPVLRAANGEVLVGTKDGVEYILRFGEIASVDDSTEEGKLNRYLFVTTQVDQAHFPPLQLEPLPEGDDKKAPAEADKKNAETEDGEKKDAENDPGVDDADKKDDVEKKSALELERERITKENQRKRDEREENLKKAKTKVSELNARFADWFYVIAEDEYKKIHLNRNSLIKQKDSASEEGFGVDALRTLEKEGIDKPNSGD